MHALLRMCKEAKESTMLDVKQTAGDAPLPCPVQ